jgi:two-component sensor histidine kinase
MSGIGAELLRRRSLIVSVSLSFFLLFLAAGATLWLAREGARADQSVMHTLSIKHSVGELLTTLLNAETGQRGYILTGDADFLEPYQNARASIQRQIVDLRTLVGADDEQRQRVDGLVPLIERRLTAMANTIGVADQDRRAEALAMIRTRGGRQLMSEIRDRIGQLDSTETVRQQLRQQEVAVTRERLNLAIVAVLVAAAALAGFALASVRRYVALIDESHQQLAAYNADLERRVNERTDELARVADLANRERNRAETLLTDVNHRVGNNLALVSSFLTMQQRAVKSTEAARALDAARARVQAIASAHRKLRLGADFASVKVDEVLAAVLDDIAAGLPQGGGVKITYQLAPLEIHARDAVSLGVLTSELVMNAVKHAFPAQSGGVVSVTFGVESGAAAVLQVSDDGVGWQHEKQESGGLGSRIIDMVSRQFGGEPQRSTHRSESPQPGTCVRIILANLQLMQTD